MRKLQPKLKLHWAFQKIERNVGKSILRLKTCNEEHLST